MHILVNFVPDVSHRVADNHLFRSVRYICSMLASNAVTFYKITLSLLNQRIILYQHSYDRCTNILASELHKKTRQGTVEEDRNDSCPVILYSLRVVRC